MTDIRLPPGSEPHPSFPEGDPPNLKGVDAPNPGAIWALINGYGGYWATVAATRLRVFDALARGPLNAPALATQLHCDRERLEVLCDALVAVGLLVRTEAAYALTPVADAFLVSGRARSMRDLVVHSPGDWSNWAALAGTIAGDPPPVPIDERFYAKLVDATYPTQRAVASAVVSTLRPIDRVLELGAGGAPWSAAVLTQFPSAAATVNDLPAVATHALRKLSDAGVLVRCNLAIGDYFEIPIEPAVYDVVVCGHILRTEGAERAVRLLKRARGALRPGGHVVVSDYFVDDDHRGPANALLLGLTMVANTPRGRTFTITEFRDWLRAAGFAEIALLDPVPFQQVLVARVPA